MITKDEQGYFPSPVKWYTGKAYLPVRTTTGWIWFKPYYRKEIWLREGGYDSVYYTPEGLLAAKLKGEE